MTNHCIICYKGLGIPHPPKQTERDVSSKSREKFEMFFKLLERYLKDPGDKCFQPFPVWESIFDAGTPISCGACQGVMESFCELFHQMKSIELLINWKLWTLKNIMYSAERVPSRLNEFKEAFIQMKDGNGGGVDQLNLILSFKHALIRKCRTKLLTALPRLQLVKFHQVKIEEPEHLPAVDMSDVGVKSNRTSMTGSIQVIGNKNIPLNPLSMTLEAEDTPAIDQYSNESVASNPHIVSANFRSIPKQLSKNSEGSSKKRKRREVKRKILRGALEKTRKRARPNVTKVRTLISIRDESEASSSNAVKQELNFNKCDQRSSKTCAFAGIGLDRIEGSSIVPTVHQITAGESDLKGEPESMDDYTIENTITDEDVFLQNETPLEIPSASTKEDLTQAIILTSNIVKTETSPNKSSDLEVVSILDFASSTKFVEVVSFSERTPANSDSDVAVVTEPEIELEEIVPAVAAAEWSEDSSIGRLRAVHRCAKCMKTFSTARRLLEHHWSHGDEEYSDSKSTGDGGSSSEVENSSSQDKEDDTDTSLVSTDGRLSVKTTAVNNIPCHIKNCKEVFHAKEDLQMHKQLHGEFNCSFCESTKDNAPDLAWHEIMEHSSIVEKRKFIGKKSKRKTFKCPRQDCSYLCHTKTTYLNHHISEHLRLRLPKRSQSCDICKACFFGAPCVLSKSLHHHYKTHHDIQNVADGEVHKCNQDKCPAYFLTLQQLVIHKTKVHEIQKRYNCSDCNSIFKDASSLHRHNFEVHGKKPSFSFATNSGGTLFNDSESDDSEPEYYNDNENAELHPTEDTACEEDIARADFGKNGFNADANKCNGIKLKPSKTRNKTHERATRASYRASVIRREKLAKKFTCFFCDVTTDFAWEIARHEIREHSQVTENVQRLCPFSDSGLKDASEIFTCPRPNCSLCSVNEEKYIEHFVLEHAGEIPIEEKDALIFMDMDGNNIRQQ